MKARFVRALEALFVWTVGPVILFFSPKARKVRIATFVTAGAVGAAWWTGFVLWALGFLVGQIPGGWLGGDLNAHEHEVLVRTLTETVDEDSPVYLHSMRMERRAERFAELEGLPRGALQAAAILHDATLEHPQIPAEARFCTHGQTGAVIGVRVLRQLEERNGWFTLAIGDAVLRHVGPTGYNWEWQDKRLASKRCEQRLPNAVSKLSKALYDLDNLDHMTVEHAVELAGEKMREPGKGKKSLQDVVRSGADSVFKELSDRAQTLQTRTGKGCGKQIRKHTTEFIKGLDFKRVKDLSGLTEAARTYLSDHPTPGCLDAPTAASDADPDENGPEDAR